MAAVQPVPTTVGAHACFVPVDEEERLEAAAAFVAEGLARGERIACVGEGGAAALLPSHVGQRTPVEDLLARRQLLDNPPEAAYPPGAGFDPGAAVRSLEALVDDAVLAGYGGLRVLFDHGWLRERPRDAVRWIRYELVISRVVARRPVLALCAFPPQEHDELASRTLWALHDRAVPAELANPSFQIHVDELDDLVVEGEIDAFCVHEFLEILHAAEGSGLRALDLSRLAFIDMAGAAAIHGSTAGALPVTGAPELLRRIWAFLGLEDEHRLTGT